MKAHTLFSLVLILVTLTGCRSVIESTSTERRDTVIVFQPLPVDTVFIVGETPSGVFNPNCDTLSILDRYADFEFVSADKHYTLLSKYEASTRRLRILETRPAEKEYVTIESIYNQTKVVKDSLWDRLKTMAVGGFIAIGLGIVALVVLKMKGIV